MQTVLSRRPIIAFDNVYIINIYSIYRSSNKYIKIHNRSFKNRWNYYYLIYIERKK